MKVAIIDYGAGNIKSVQFALNRIGIDSLLTSDHIQISSADKVILPGVGEAGSAMSALKALSLDKLVKSLKQPVMGVCLGMQLMCSYSEESNTECLGIFTTKVKLFNTNLKVPHVGWNTLEDLSSKLFKEIDNRAYMYFVHSYYVPISEYTIAKTTYDATFAAAIQKDNFYGCQFHPEKSSMDGQQLITNFIEL